MRARKCDRCGKFYDHYEGFNRANGEANGEDANAVMFIDRDIEDKYYDREIYDLCSDCMLAVINYITGKEEENDTNN